MSHTMSAWGSSQLPPPRYSSPVTGPGHSASTAGRGGIWDVKSAVVGGTWSSTSGTMSLQHCGDPFQTTREAQGDHPQAGHTQRTLLNSIQHGHITQIPLEDGPWTLTPHRKWENECPYSKGFFLSVNFSLLGCNQHFLLSQGRDLLSVGPIFPCLEYDEPHILVICTISQALDGHL